MHRGQHDIQQIRSERGFNDMKNEKNTKNG